MQRAVAIALAGGLLAASAGAFGLAQVLKLERSPIEAIQVDPTPNHGRGHLDRHDSALFSPRCTAPCRAAAVVRFKVRTSGPVSAKVVSAAGAVVRNLGLIAHPGGRALARWDGRDAAGAVAPAGSYRLEVHLSGRTIKLLNPLTLDTSVDVLGTNVSRRVISPDCDTHGDRVTVVVRAGEQLTRVQLELRKAGKLVRTVRVGKRARALAVSWPPYDGKRCTTAPDGGYALLVVARDVAGNTRAFGLGEIAARGVGLALPDRAIIAGKRLRIGISSDAGGLRLDLARLGSAAAVLARRTHAPAAVVRIPAATPGGIYVVSNKHAGRTAEALLAVRGAKRARVALAVVGPAATDLPYQRKLDTLGIHFDVLTQRDIARGALAGYAIVVVPPPTVGSAAVELPPGHGTVVGSLAGIVPGLGS
jgi:FlgD Ig-like domain